MNNEFFIKQIDDILKDYNLIKSKAIHDDLSNVPIEEITSTLTKAKATITRITGANSSYYKDIEAFLQLPRAFAGTKLKYIIGTVSALRSDIQNNFLKSLTDIIQGDVFSDYLEMADHLLIEGYKDPAAVLIGSTLESHIRELCKSHQIEIELTNSKGNIVSKKADLMNSELAKANVYSSSYQKQIVAWLSIRNFAAHGKYSEYTNEEVKLMLQGVRQFILSTN
jgi:hypothetical protein